MLPGIPSDPILVSASIRQPSIWKIYFQLIRYLVSMYDYGKVFYHCTYHVDMFENWCEDMGRTIDPKTLLGSRVCKIMPLNELSCPNLDYLMRDDIPKIG